LSALGVLDCALNRILGMGRCNRVQLDRQGKQAGKPENDGQGGGIVGRRGKGRHGFIQIGAMGRSASL
jgi:hypothetical protein